MAAGETASQLTISGITIFGRDSFVVFVLAVLVRLMLVDTDLETLTLPKGVVRSYILVSDSVSLFRGGLAARGEICCGLGAKLKTPDGKAEAPDIKSLLTWYHSAPSMASGRDGSPTDCTLNVLQMSSSTLRIGII